MLISGCDDGKMLLWQLEGETPSKPLLMVQEKFLSMALVTNNIIAYVVPDDDKVKLFNIKVKQSVQELDTGEWPITICLSNSKLFVGCKWGKCLDVYGVRDLA